MRSAGLWSTTAREACWAGREWVRVGAPAQTGGGYKLARQGRLLKGTQGPSAKNQDKRSSEKRKRFHSRSERASEKSWNFLWAMQEQAGLRGVGKERGDNQGGEQQGQRWKPEKSPAVAESLQRGHLEER